jgi:hypothetical protein
MMQDVNETSRRFNVITLKTMHVLVAGLPCFELNSWLSHPDLTQRSVYKDITRQAFSLTWNFVTYGLQDFEY